jgi:hypothetical protein
VSEKDITKALISCREYIENPELVTIRQGFSLLDLKHYIDSHGYGKLTLPDLIKKAPILAPVNFLGYNHFVPRRHEGSSALGRSGLGKSNHAAR